MANEDRPSSFQPEKPHAQGGGSSRATLFAVAAAAALMVVMVLAIWAPRLFGDNRWLFTLGAGALTFAVVVGIGFVRRSRG